jgi:O-antigen ligase
MVIAERALLGVFLGWLVFLPLPFGAVVEGARLPLIAVPLTLCCVVSLVRLYATRDRTNTAQPTRPWNVWGSGALLFLAVVALQLIPLPPSVVAWISPDSYTIWRSASRLTTLAGGGVRSSFPTSIDPRATALELFRLTGLFAAFVTAALLIRTSARRRALAITACAVATFEVLYGVREAALGRYAVWGWINKLVYGRITGTFVNPNHFAHYLAVVLPLPLYLAATLWRRAGSPETPFARRLVILLETMPLRFGIAALTAVACGAGVLLSQSRGALLALLAGLLFVTAMIPGRRMTRVALAALGGIAAVLTLALVLGRERTIERFTGTVAEAEGRTATITAALRVWHRYSILGSGAGTFEFAVPMEHRGEMAKLYTHAHNDYAEIGATTGTLGFTVAMVALIGGYVALARMTFGHASADLAFTRRAFQAAALASMTIAMTHALVDFNFFIPSNAGTLAAISGAAVASVDHDRRTRR